MVQQVTVVPVGQTAVAARAEARAGVTVRVPGTR